MLQSGEAQIQSGAGSITKWSRYYKVRQVLLQSGAGITKWGIITKWCITEGSNRGKKNLFCQNSTLMYIQSKLQLADTPKGGQL